MRCMVIVVKRMMDGNRELKDSDNGATRLHKHYVSLDEADRIVNEHMLKLNYYPPFNSLHLCLVLLSATEARDRIWSHDREGNVSHVMISFFVQPFCEAEMLVPYRLLTHNFDYNVKVWKVRFW